jgi:hypothetical protein
VAFRSAASNLVPGDTNDVDDIFVHDRQTSETWRVSVASEEIGVRDCPAGQDNRNFQRRGFDATMISRYGSHGNTVNQPHQAIHERVISHGSQASCLPTVQEKSKTAATRERLRLSQQEQEE